MRQIDDAAPCRRSRSDQRGQIEIGGRGRAEQVDRNWNGVSEADIAALVDDPEERIAAASGETWPDKYGRQSRADVLLAMVGLSQFTSKHPQELSGGMQQRAAICRALIQDPDILLMDEPFGALDALTREEMCFELLRIWERSSKTIVFVTHSISEAVLLSDRVMVMTPRQGVSRIIVSIDIPRPRTLASIKTKPFQEAVDRIRTGIYGKMERLIADPLGSRAHGAARRAFSSPPWCW